MNLRVTSEIETALTREAQRQGTTPEELALACLRERFIGEIAETSTEGSANPADYLADSIGVLSSSEFVPGGARLSQDTGRKFTDALLKRRQQGRR